MCARRPCWLSSKWTLAALIISLAFHVEASASECCFIVFDQDPTTEATIRVTVEGRDFDISIDPAKESTDDAVAQKVIAVLTVGGFRLQPVGDTGLVIFHSTCSAVAQIPSSGTVGAFSNVPSGADLMVFDNGSPDTEGAGGETGAAGGVIRVDFPLPIGPVAVGTFGGDSDFETRNQVSAGVAGASVPVPPQRFVGPTGLAILDGSAAGATSTDVVRNIDFQNCPQVIPTLGRAGAIVLALFLAAAAVLAVRRSQRA